MKRLLFLFLVFGGFFVAILALNPPTIVHAQCGGPNDPPCPPPPSCGEPNGPDCPGGGKKNQPTPYPSYTLTATATNTPLPTDTATPLACLPAAGANDPGQSAADTEVPSLFPGLLIGGGGIFLGGILIGLLIAGIIGPSMGAGSKAPGKGELLPAVNQGGIIGPVDNAGIIGPVDNAGIWRSVNGDYPPGTPEGVNGDEVFHKHLAASDVQPSDHGFFKYDRPPSTPGALDGGGQDGLGSNEDGTALNNNDG